MERAKEAPMTDTAPDPALHPDARCAPDPGRAILRVTGPDRAAFLQGMVTQDMNRLAARGILYAALLTPQGKYLADFFLVAEEDDAVLIDVAEGPAADLEKRLALYKLRSKVTIERVAMPVTRGTGPAPEGALPDPRDATLGWRLYGAALTQGEEPDWDACASRPACPRRAPNWSRTRASSWRWASSVWAASISARAATWGRRSPPGCATRRR
jgi:tRNA-modifying protein YgfZ